MIIATRNLKLRVDDNEIDVPVRLHAPVFDEEAWNCSFEIVWPDETWHRYAVGIDAIQALRLALEMIGILLYTSDHHKSGNLFWERASGGFGFPVSQGVRHILVGDDAIFEK